MSENEVPETAKPFIPFADEATALQIDSLTVENRTDRVDLYGMLAITRDKAGLEIALTLKAVLDAAVEALQAADDLPDRIAEGEGVDTAPNPFSERTPTA